MHNPSFREEDCFVFLVDAPREVNVFGVHEESFVEKPCFHKGFRSEEHETAL